MYAEPGNIDGGGNLAAGNVEPAQCFGIVCATATSSPPGLPDTTILEKPAERPEQQPQRAASPSSATTTRRRSRSSSSSAASTAPTSSTGRSARTRRSTAALAPGRHTLRGARPRPVRDRRPDAGALQLDLHAARPRASRPNTTIDLAPPLATPLFDAVFQFSSNEPDVTLPVPDRQRPVARAPTTRRWRAGFYAYEHEFEEHEVGPHTFQVRAIDIEGNVDPTPAVHNWTITGLITTILSGPAYEPGENGEPASGGETEEHDGDVRLRGQRDRGRVRVLDRHRPVRAVHAAGDLHRAWRSASTSSA